MRRPKTKRKRGPTLRPRRVEEQEPNAAASVEGEEAVLSLDADADSFDEAVAKHPFLVVQFYAPWCPQSKKLAPEYEKAARLLSKHDPAIVLVKVDANDDKNWALATAHNIQGFPTLKIFRNYGNKVQEFKGPSRDDAEGIVDYLKKQIGPASKEIKSPEDATAAVLTTTSHKTICINFSNFMMIAERLRSDSDFALTLNANYLPRGDVTVVERPPFVRLFKPFDDLVTECNCKAMLFLSFSDGAFDSFKSTYYAAAVYFKDKEIKFLIGDIEASKGALRSFGLKKDQVPLILIRHGDSVFLKGHIEAEQIVTWLKDYFDGKLTPFKKSQPIPEVNNEPVKVVVAESLHDVVFKSGKNVLIELYAPWCRDCKKLAPILEEAATTLQSDDEVVVAKMDGTANDVPSEFDGDQIYPSMYLVTASGKVTAYDGGWTTANEIVDFVKKNKETARATNPAATAESVKDEL